MKLIVGLGNPGEKYKDTRHNIGFRFVDEYAKGMQIDFSLNKQLKSLISVFQINNEKVIIIKPQTFMNLSGEAVLAVVNYYKIALEDILVIYDDLDLPTSKVRIRMSGSSGGHKGMENIIQLLKTSEIKRLRIGIMNYSNINTIDYVLGRFTEDELALVELTISKSKQMIDSYIRKPFVEFMDEFNRSSVDE